MSPWPMACMGHETVSSNVVTVEFDNDDGYVVTAELGHNSALDDDGNLWYGGPSNEHVVISALAVNYSGAEAGAVVVRLDGCEAEENDEFDCDGEDSDRQITVLSGGEEGKILNAEDLPVINIDMEGPGAPTFEPNPNKREGGWVNAAVGFTAKYADKKGSRDNWLNYGDEGAGVGGYTAQIRFAESGDDDEVGGALAAPALPQLVLPPALAGQSSKPDHFCVVASAVDKLGNESDLPDADAACVSAEDYDAEDEDKSAGLLAGVDLQAPTIAFSPASPKADAATMRNFQVQLADEGSGIRENSPLKAAVNLRDKDDDEEIEDLEISVSLPLATTVGLPSGVGYYTFTGSVTDKAGNVSEEATRTALDDMPAPGASTIVGDYDDKKGQFTLVATVTDNLSIKAYWAEARFGTGATLSLRALGDDGTVGTPIEITQGLFLPQEGANDVDAYNAPSLTQAALASDLKAKSYRALQADNDAEGATLTNLNSLVVVSSDHGGQKSATAAPAAGTGLVPADFAGFDLSASDIGSTGTVAAADIEGIEASDYKTFTAFTAEADQSGGDVEVTVEASGRFFTMPVVEVVEVVADPNADPPVEAVAPVAEVVGNEGLRDNPLTRIDFYATTTTFDIDVDDDTDETTLKYIGSVDGAAAGAQDFDANIDGDAATTANDSRKYIYTMTISEAALADAVGSKGEYTGHIVAFGVKDDKGAALSAPAVPVTIEK